MIMANLAARMMSLSFVLALAACAEEKFIVPDRTVPVLSLDDLHNRASLYDSKIISVDGYLDIAVERRFLQQNPPSEGTRAGPTCVTLFSAGRILEHLDRYNGKHIRLTGRYMSNFGELRLVNLGACGSSGLDLDNDYELKLLQ